MMNVSANLLLYNFCWYKKDFTFPMKLLIINQLKAIHLKNDIKIKQILDHCKEGKNLPHETEDGSDKQNVTETSSHNEDRNI